MVKHQEATLERVNQEIQLKLEKGDSTIIAKQKVVIAGLRAELQELNTKSMAAVQELSSQNHEALMQERVHTINLQAKIYNLSKELNESYKQL